MSINWLPIETAPEDELIIVFAPGVQDLNDLVSLCQYHPSAGFCVDELRQPTHWIPFNPPKMDHENTQWFGL